jgi:hypothetical protein
VNMEDFHCDLFELTFTFEAGEFDKESFLKKIGKNESDYIDHDGDLALRVFLPSRESVSKQHGHLRIIVRPDTSGQVDLDFHKPGAKKVKKKPPYLENSVKWLGQFFNVDEVPVRIDIGYEFDEKYTPTIPLPFPLVVTSEPLSGLKVSGLSLTYPEDHPVKSTIVQVAEGELYLFVLMETILRFKEFDFVKQLNNLQSTVVKSLVRKQESGNGGNKKAKKA